MAAERYSRSRVEISIDDERGVYMISVAAELADMHPQTLRIYESKGLIQPKRSPKNTRLYSQADVERLRRIQQMTNEEGLNLAGVETVLEMEERVDAMRDFSCTLGAPVVWLTHAGVIRAATLLSGRRTHLQRADQWPVDGPGFGAWTIQSCGPFRPRGSHCGRYPTRPQQGS